MPHAGRRASDDRYRGNPPGGGHPMTRSKSLHASPSSGMDSPLPAHCYRNFGTLDFLRQPSFMNGSTGLRLTTNSYFLPRARPNCSTSPEPLTRAPPSTLLARVPRRPARIQRLRTTAQTRVEQLARPPQRPNLGAGAQLEGSLSRGEAHFPGRRRPPPVQVIRLEFLSALDGAESVQVGSSGAFVVHGLCTQVVVSRLS